jgi:hypothetical protein
MSHHTLKYSRISQHFIKPYGSLPCSQKPATVPIISQIIPVHTTPHHIFLRYILILSSHLHLGLSSGLFPFGFRTKILHVFPLQPTRATCPAHLIPLIILIMYLAKSTSYEADIDETRNRMGGCELDPSG